MLRRAWYRLTDPLLLRVIDRDPSPVRAWLLRQASLPLRSHHALTATIGQHLLPLVTVRRPLLPLANFCRRGVGWAWFAAWRLRSLRAMPEPVSRLAWTPIVLMALLIVAWIVSRHVDPAPGTLMAALPTILFNAGTGSDTAASGAGPGTALSGTGAATVAASATVSLVVDNPDLSGVATDGSAVIWVDSSSGRQYGKISAVDNTVGVKTVTISPGTYANTEGTKNWGIGGKRATLDHADSRTAFADMAPGWIFSLEDNQTISSPLAPTVAGDTTTGPIVWKSSASGTARTITTTAASQVFSMASANNNHYNFIDLKFANSNASKANALNWSSSGGTGIVFLRCATDATNKVQRLVNRSATAVLTATFWSCDANSCTSNGVNLTSATQCLEFYGCLFRDNGAAGLAIDTGVFLAVVNCIFDTNSGDGINIASALTWGSGPKQITSNVFYANTGDGLDFASGANFARGLVHTNNIYKDQTGTGVRGFAGCDALVAVNDYNDYHGNGSTTVNFTMGANDVTLDPQFTDAPNGDFSIGTNLKGLGWPGVFPAGLTTGYLDIGAAQRQEPTSSGGQSVSIFGG